MCIVVAYLLPCKASNCNENTAREQTVLSQDIHSADVKQSEVTVRWAPPKSLGDRSHRLRKAEAMASHFWQA